MILSMPILGGSLRSRSILAFSSVVFITTIAFGIPAFLFLRNALQSQTWDQVTNGARITRSMLLTQEDQLSNLALLTAEQPTLKEYLHDENGQGLGSYIQTYQSSLNLDLLFLLDDGGQILVSGNSSINQFTSPITQGITYQQIPGNPPIVALLSVQPIWKDPSDGILGYVILGKLLNDEFCRALYETTGFEHSIVVNGTQVASSHGGMKTSIDPKLLNHTMFSDQIEKRLLEAEGVRYYSAFFPINDHQQTRVALVEVSLPADSLLPAERKALLSMIGGMTIIILVGSALGILFTRRLTQSLLQLTRAATTFSQGDVETPFPTLKGPIEIAALAQALEASRIKARQMLADLSQAKSWSEAIIQSIHEGIVTIDEDARITSFSRGAESIMGCLSYEVIGKSINQVFLLADNHRNFTDLMPAYGTRRQIEVLAHGERVVTLAVTHAQLTSMHPEAMESVLVMRDITEEEAANSLRTYFLGNISHEFRTPLAAINASVELLLEELEGLSTAEISELLHSTHMSVSGLQTLIDNLLESISIEAGKFQIRRRLTDLNTVIVNVIRVMKPLLDRRQQHLSIEKAAELPKVHADPTRLTQVLVNLFSNASKYSPVGETIELSIRQSKDQYLRIAVADRGPGIPNTERVDIFRRFVRLDLHEGAQFGIGLGLSVVKVIVEEHGGSVGVDDRPGGGSIFWFTLPLDGGGQ